MKTSDLGPLGSAVSVDSARLPSASIDAVRSSSPPATGAWRYAGVRKSRLLTVVSVILSATLHTTVLFCFNQPPIKTAPPVKEVVTTLALMLTEVKDLEEPEPEPSDEPSEVVDVGMPAPMQADAPQLPQPADFVQELDFASLVEQPDINKNAVFSIPSHIRQGGKGGDGIGKIFDLADLDRQPQPTVQPAPIYPESLKSEASTATVRVEFIIDTDGSVRNAFVVESTHGGFNTAAVIGVGRWKFRPGIRQGKKVKTRMQVPIVFSLKERNET